MNKEEFYKLSEEEQRRLSSEFRKTVHEGEIVFIYDEDSKSLTPEEVREKLIKQRNELLDSLGFSKNNNFNNKKINDDFPRHSR